jgi:hypothetical protein
MFELNQHVWSRQTAGGRTVSPSVAIAVKEWPSTPGRVAAFHDRRGTPLYFADAGQIFGAAISFSALEQRLESQSLLRSSKPLSASQIFGTAIRRNQSAARDFVCRAETSILGLLLLQFGAHG